MIEIRIHMDNFINSALDYDPEISVLFDGGGSGGGGCDSDDYSVVSDWVFWASLGCAVGALCLVCLVLFVGSTDCGLRRIRGRDNMKSVMRQVRRRTDSYNSQELRNSMNSRAAADSQTSMPVL